MVDVATLTGACVTALGKGVAAGLFSTDGALRERLLAFRARHLEAALPDFEEILMNPRGEVFVLKIIKEFSHQRHNRFVGEVIERSFGAPLDVAHLPHHDVHLGLKLGLLCKDPIEFLPRYVTRFHSGLQLFDAHRVALNDRGDFRPARGTALDLDNFKSPLPDAPLEVLEHTPLPILEVLKHGFSLLNVSPALKDGRDAFQQLIEERPHVFLE